MDNKEIENIASNNSTSINIKQYNNESNQLLLNKIFIYKKNNEKEIYQPLLINSSLLGDNIMNIFTTPSSEIKSNINTFNNFINNKIQLFNEMKKIIGNSYEIYHIMINYLEKNKISPITFFIDLYFDYLQIDNNEEILNNLIDIIMHFFSCGFMNKQYTDYIYQKLSKIQFENKLTPEIFYSCLSLIEIIYGKNFNYSYKQNLIAKNYMYFYNKENSKLKTNISKSNNIIIKDGCSIIIWFYIKNDLVMGSKLCSITIEKEKAQNHTIFDFILNEKNDIEIRANDTKGNLIILKEQDNKVFNIHKNKWIQLKIQIMKLGIKLNLFQGFKEIKNKKEEGSNEEDDHKIKYETKMFQTNNKKCSNNNDLNFDLNNFIIIDLSFFVNYVGYAGTIIFCKNNNPSETPINSLYGLKSNKIPNFKAEIGLSEIFFIFSPSLFVKEKNKFIYMDNNITGEFSISNSFQESNAIIDYNYVYKYCNYFNNIYKLGGMVNILPLFEIFYKFTKNKNNEDKKDISILNNIFSKLMKLLELIIVNKEKNYLNMYYNNDIFESFQLFFENIEEKYYQNNDDILLILVNIGKYIFEYCKKKFSSFEYSVLNESMYNYFKYILFYPKIVLKFSLEQQNKIWNFFKHFKNVKEKKSKNIENDNNIIYYKKCFLSFSELNNFILLFNEKYPNEFLSPSLINIIKNIFLSSATNDYERESLLLLVNSSNQNQNRISDEIIISIIEVFVYYLDIHYNKYISNNTKLTEFFLDNNKDYYYSPITSIKSFLSSQNYFIETLLGLLTTDNLNLKKDLLNFLRIIFQNYGDILKAHFKQVENNNKKSKKIKQIHRVTEDELFYFIQENIIPNPNNQKIREMKKFIILKNDNSKDKKIDINGIRRQSTIDGFNTINNNIENKNYKNNNNKKNGKSKKDIIKKSKSCEKKDLSEIKKKFYHNTDKHINQRRKTDFNYLDIRFSQLSNPNLGIKNQSIRVSYDKNEKISEIEENENVINENEIKEKNKDLLEIQGINCQITIILFYWLIKSEKKINSKRSSGNLLSFSSISFDNYSSELSDTIINFILKLLSSNKNLEEISKFLYMIIGQKGFNFSENEKNIKNNILSINDDYLRLIGYFSSSKTKFLQFLEELLINSYLCLYLKDTENKFVFIEEDHTENSIIKDKNEYFKNIYEKVKELIIDIYFSDINSYRNDIILNIFNIILYLSGGLKDKKDLNEKDLKTKDILFNLIKDLLTEILEIYNIKFEAYKHKKKIKKQSSKDLNNSKNNENISLINDKNEKIHLNHLLIRKNYSIFITFIFEYILLLINSNNYISNIFQGDLNKLKNFGGIPDFLKYEIDIKGNKKEIPCQIGLYLKVWGNINYIFNIENLLEKISQEKKDNKQNSENKDKKENDQKELFRFGSTEINKLFKEFSANKDLKSNLKERLELLFLNYKEIFKNFPLITIITIFNNYYINLYINLNQEEITKSEFNQNFDFIQFLNYHMQFILFIILISCSIKENENYPIKEKTNKEIQEIIFANLLYNINNIIFFFDSQYATIFIEIFTNIITLISYLNTNDNDHKIIFHLGKNKSKNAGRRILNYYITKYISCFNRNLFNNTNLEIMSNQNIIENKDLLSLETNNIYNSIFRNNNEDKIDLPTEDIFDLGKYKSIYISRKFDNRKLKLFFTENSDKISFEFENENENEENYKNILLKVDSLRVKYDNNDLYNKFYLISKRKNYRKIKKKLYSWNNSYSNLEAFYKNKDIMVPKKGEVILKYKLSNYLSKDMTRKLLVPILDIDYYMPNFKLFNYKEKLFQNNEENIENQYKQIYKIDLKIFDDSKYISNQEYEEKYLIESACYIKTTHHIRGKLFLDKNLLSNNIINSASLCHPNSYLFFIEYNPYSTEKLLKNFEDYDSDHKTCFGSIFINNNNNKDSEIFLKFDLNDIIFIFFRKYCFRNEGIEIFLSNHRSYYFKFLDAKNRDKFLNGLISVLNNNNPKNKLFKPIKGIDENNKSSLIGYFKDENSNKEYSTISNIRDLWKSNKISTLEYLMWINIYGNRSFRDISQYPVFPWLLTKYEYNTYEELVKSPEIRDFRLPMGMLYIDEKSKKRQEGYIEIYKNMIIDLNEQNILDITIKEEEENNEQNNNKIIRNTIANPIPNFPDAGSIVNPNQKAERNESVIINYQALPSLTEQTQDKILPKIPNYKYDIEKLYNNPNYEYDKIPYFFGSHFSNSMYVSHYLVRIFPYSFTLIEIQGDGFDISDRLFFKLQSSFYTAISEKCDLREIIPEFFTLPEMFININSLEMGKMNSNIIKGDNKNQEDETNRNENEMIQLNEVIMPKWCKNNPYLFVEKYRRIIESSSININPWIDLIFGSTQRGIRAQRIGNLFLPYTYDGVINIRLSKQNLLKNREDNEYLIRLFEMGVNPCKVFDKRNKITRSKPINQLIEIGTSQPEALLPEVKLKLNNSNRKIIYINCYLSQGDELYVLDNEFNGQKINIQETKESGKNYIIKESISFRELPIKSFTNKNIQNKLIIKSIFKHTFFIITGYFDGSLYLIKSQNKISKKEEAQNQETKPYNINEENLIKIFDNSLITALEIDKYEKYLIYGTEQGSIAIYSLNYNLFKDNKIFIKFNKIFKSHNKYSISSISINNDLNLFADCAYDGYVNIYTLSSYSNFEIINSIYIDTSIYNFTLDYVFLSAQPLASIVLYSNDKCQFKCFSINGTNLQSAENDTFLTSNKFNEYYSDNDESMSCPIIYTGYMFNDYLIYIFKKYYVLIREFPSMKMIMALNPTRDNLNEELSLVCISNDNKYLYIMEQKNNKIYIVNQKVFTSNNKVKKSL